jgi:transposase InsO family protein
VVDAFTRECLALEPDVSLGSGRVTRVLDGVIAEHGRPESLRSDNGPEFCSRRMLGWAEERKIALVHIQPGRPMQNGRVESFHGRLREQHGSFSLKRTNPRVEDFYWTFLGPTVFSGNFAKRLKRFGVPDGIRTRVIAVKGRCPRPG